MRTNPGLTSFNGGEVSPLIAGRPELEKYQAGLRLCENFIPRVQGALERRGGTRFVATTKDNGRAWLLEFIYSQSDAFVLEFGDEYIRFFRSRGQFTTGSVTAWSNATAYTVGDLAENGGVKYYCILAHTNQSPPNATYWYPLTSDIYEIPSPWTLADLEDEDGSFALRYVQSGDIVYFAHPNHAPRKLTRQSNTQWVLEELETTGGPFKDQNTEETTTVTVTGTLTVGSTVTIDATDPIFESGHVGSLFYIEMKDGSDVKAWEVNIVVDVGDIRRSDGKYYECTQVGSTDTSDRPAVTGSIQPTHTTGKYWDGNGEDKPGDGNNGSLGVEWEFLHAGYGWVRISAFSTSTSVTAEVLSRLPDELTTTATFRWAHGAWSDVEGYPSDVTFFRERLTFAKGQELYFSVAGDFENFRNKDFGETTIANATRINTQSGRGDRIKWLVPFRKRLLVGTGGAEVSIGQQTANEPFGPGNTQTDPEEENGSKGVAPAVVGSSVLFVDKSARAIRDMAYDLNSDGFASIDTTIFAEHLFDEAIVDMTFQKRPHSVLWCASDSYLRCFTFMRQQEVSGWHRQNVQGDVESTACIPTPAGDRDEVWLIAKRTIDGNEVRYVEYVTSEYRDGDDAALAGYSDSHLVYNGVSATTITGLDHLEGEEVWVKVNGAYHPNRTVASGAITLNAAATKVVVGLPSPAMVEVMPIESGAQAGTAQGKLRRIHRLKLRLRNSLGGAVGPDADHLEVIQYRGRDPMDESVPLFTGLRTVEFNGGYEEDGSIYLKVDTDNPFTLIALLPEMGTYES